MRLLSIFSIGVFVSLITFMGCNNGKTVKPESVESVKISQYATDESSIYTNAYIIETSKSVVVIDATLTVSASKKLRQKVDDLDKPLVGVFITHGHPDHYNGLGYLTEGTDAKIYASQGVYDVIAESDAAKEKQWTQMFGDEWPRNRTFPNAIVGNEDILIDGVRFNVHPVGPGESHQDTYITVYDTKKRAAFVGDIILNGVHAYVTDGHLTDWLRTLDVLPNKLRDYETIYPGHGVPGGVELFTWQKEYLQTYIKEVKAILGDETSLSDADKTLLAKKMKVFLPNDKLLFLVGLGADTVVEQIVKGTL